MECHPGVPARWVILLPQNPVLPHQHISELMYLQPGNRGWGSQKVWGEVVVTGKAVFWMVLVEFQHGWNVFLVAGLQRG